MERYAISEKVKQAVNIPVLRKDFIVDTFQLYESKGNGADAVLLIAALLKDKTAEYVDKTHELGMEALVEVHTQEDLQYALSSKANLIGINNRDLHTLKVELGTTEDACTLHTKNRIIIDRKRNKTKKDITRLQRAGASAFLIGTTLMSSQQHRKNNIRTYWKMIKTKICGLTRKEDITYAAYAGADAVGVVNIPTSKRYVNLQDTKNYSTQSPRLSQKSSSHPPRR